MARIRSPFVFGVMSHDAPDQLLRLVRRLRRDHPGCAVVVYHDATRVPAPDEALRAIDDVDLIETPRPVHYATGAHMEATLDLLRFVDERYEFEWFCKLSGRCYPIKPGAATRRQLLASSFDAEIEAFRADEPPWSPQLARSRYYRRHHWIHADVIGRMGRVRRGRVARVGYVLDPTLCRLELSLPARVPFSASFPCLGGSDWFDLRSSAVRAILRACEDRPALVGYYTRTVNAAESFFATVLGNDPTLSVSGNHGRYIRFATGNSHPDVLTAAEVPRMLASGHRFARKFDLATQPSALDLLDAALDGESGLHECGELHRGDDGEPHA